ncbi:MAG: hypothetical protein PWR16_495 [Methanoculleus sp.]|nr:hypothetical protein [Methanoculleus sp.]
MVFSTGCALLEKKWRRDDGRQPRLCRVQVGEPYGEGGPRRAHAPLSESGACLSRALLPCRRRYQGERPAPRGGVSGLRPRGYRGGGTQDRALIPSGGGMIGRAAAGPPPVDASSVTPGTAGPAPGPDTRPAALLPGAGTGRRRRPRTICPGRCRRDCSSR